MLTQDDGALILFLSAGGGCSLDSSPGENWVERSGGLPNYICKIAKGVMRSGKSKSSAIAIAVSRVKAWAAGGDDVDADTQAKAASAAAQWEKLKAKNKKSKLVKATDPLGDYVFLTDVGSFNTDLVRRAWDTQEEAKRRAAEVASRVSIEGTMATDNGGYRWIKELWTDYIIVEQNDATKPLYAKIPYSVAGSTVTFGEEERVAQVWVELSTGVLSENEFALLRDDMKESENYRVYLSLMTED